jgi:DNA repair protein RecN (Recombination protein N)
MLYALSIQSFVLIDRLDLEAADGFTALTGETGAGKSIILDALGLVMGGPADRKQVRVGAEQANITAEFLLPPDHPAWTVLERHELTFDRNEMLILRRTVSQSGPSRAFVNAQSVAAAILAELAEVLVEIHGQHAASGLMRPSTHLELLDTYGGLEALVETCRKSWLAFDEARAARQQLEADIQSARDRQEWLTFAVEELSKMAPEQGEIEALTTRRGALLQTERITDAVAESTKALSEPKLEDALMRAAKAVDRIVRIPGLETLDDKLPTAAGGASEALERTLIELAEAQSCVSTLAQYAEHDATQLTIVEERLFALRALARKYDSQPENLAETLQRFQQELALCDSDAEAFEQAVQREKETREKWQTAANRLSKSRQQKAVHLEKDIQSQLAPLHLGRVRVRVAFSPIGEDESGARGLERAAFEVQTNPGASFGPLKAIASGGELARFSLALKCALSESGSACTLIFDEADQGVGGAVAAAIGERLSELAKDRQVFAVTHSPQVASAAARQWRVMKEMNSKDQVFTHVAQLDDGQRLEEIARMLSGSSITNEARAAALKLLEAA